MLVVPGHAKAQPENSCLSGVEVRETIVELLPELPLPGCGVRSGCRIWKAFCHAALQALHIVTVRRDDARNYRYGLAGDTPPWRPVSVYDDGRRVYIEFPRGIVQGEMPPLFVVGSDGEPEIVNSRIHNNILIVDRLFGAAELRLGSGNRQQVVRIVRIAATAQNLGAQGVEPSS